MLHDLWGGESRTLVPTRGVSRNLARGLPRKALFIAFLGTHRELRWFPRSPRNPLIPPLIPTTKGQEAV